MALPVGRNQREYDKFVEATDGNVAVRVVGSSGSSSLEVNTSSVDTGSLIGKSSTTATGADFTTAYGSATEIVLGTYDGSNYIKADDIISITQVDSSGGANVLHRDEYDITVASQTATVSGASFAAGDTFVVMTNVARIATDDSAMPPTPKFAPVGGEYRASATTYTDGDATVLQTDVNGNLKVTGMGEPIISPYTHSSARGDFTATYTSNVTLTIAGAPATVSNKHLSSITVNTSAGTSARTFVNGANGVSMSISSNVITITGAGTPFAASDTYDVRLNLFDKATDTDLDSRKTIRQNMEVDQYVEESIVDTTNVATGTYYPSADGIAVGRYNNFSATGKLIDGAGETTTLTIEVTNDEDATTGNRDWQPIYVYDMINNAVVNSVAATNTTTYFALGLDKVNVKYIRYKIVTSASTNTVIIKQKKTAVM